MADTIPPDDRGPGQSGHIDDHNDISDVLAALQTSVTALQTQVQALQAGGGGGGGGGSTGFAGLQPTAVKTAAYTLSPNDFVPVDISGGSFPLTLPSPSGNQLVGATIVNTASGKQLTIQAGGSDRFYNTSGPVSVILNEEVQTGIWQYSSGVWLPHNNVFPLVPLGTNNADIQGFGTANIGNSPNAAPDNHVHPPTGPTYSATGITGASLSSRYAGATLSGAPVSGTFAIRDWVVDSSGTIWICTAPGTPGTWAQAGPNLDGTTADIKANGNQSPGVLTVSSRSDHIHPAGNWIPSDNNLLAASASIPTSGTNSGAGSISPQTLYLVKIPIRQAMTVSTIWWAVGPTTAVGASSGTFFALISSAGALLTNSSTGEIGTKFTTQGVQSAAMGAAQSLAAGFVLGAFISNFATTQPSLRCSCNALAAIANLGLSAAVSACATYGGTTTAFPSSITPSSMNQGAGVPFLLGLS